MAGIWGASFPFIDIGLDALPPGVITLMRVGLGALELVGVAFVIGGAYLASRRTAG